MDLDTCVRMHDNQPSCPIYCNAEPLVNCQLVVFPPKKQ